jgi:hypothetical protein
MAQIFHCHECGCECDGSYSTEDEEGNEVYYCEPCFKAIMQVDSGLESVPEEYWQ